MARFLNNSKMSDKIDARIILTNQELPSVNQLNAQIKLTEEWKAIKNPMHPTKWNMKAEPSVGAQIGLLDI